MITDYFEKNRDKHLKQLCELISIPSISTDPAYKDDVRACANNLVSYLKEIGFEHVTFITDEKDSHPIIYADWLHAPDQPTVLLYGHYDVQPADPIEEWTSPPFTPEIRGNILYGRGASDNKGQFFMHLLVFEALFHTYGRLPFNVKLCLEGEEESGSSLLLSTLPIEKERFQADYVILSDTAVMEENNPAICYGLRGLLGFQISLYGANRDLHSGGFHGGTVPNTLHAMVQLLASMRNEDGMITIDGFYDDVEPISETEKRLLAELPFQEKEFYEKLGVTEQVGEPGYTALERVWTRPTLEINGMYGGYQGEGSKTVIPREAHVKITCRLVSNQDPDRMEKIIQTHVEKHIPKGIRASLTFEDKSYPYVGSLDHPCLKLAAQALEEAFDKRVSFIRAGGSIPVVELFARVLQVPIIMMGFALPDANAHAPDEKFSLAHFDKGIRALYQYYLMLGEQEQNND
ncbi:dipeptidase [Brevibacillus daliensis]|uniref:dipeptidase n=1 Tax=Brevibacillus daliensis TaxID=2892995 RepID=UPI001E32A604|nr:dipeptidase [Brevibacillus daliensis]